MSDNPDKNIQTNVKFHWADVGTAASVLTRFPLKSAWVVPDRMAASVWAFPVVGAIIGALAGIMAILAAWIGLPNGSVGITAMAVMILASGAMHEDGLADCADGLGGGKSKEHALEIMKDSRIGAYGVIALVLFLIATWSALSDLASTDMLLAGLIATGAVSRAPMAVAMAYMHHARQTGLSRHVGTPEPVHAITAILVAMVFSVALLGISKGLLVCLVAALAPIPLLVLANRKIGGQTGDVLGATQQCAALGALYALSSAI